MTDLPTLATKISTIGETIANLKKATPVDTEAINTAVKELLAAKQAYADANNGIGVDGKKYEPPMTKAEKKAKARKEKAEKGGGGGGGKEKAAPDSAKAAKKAAKKAEKAAKKSAYKGDTNAPPTSTTTAPKPKQQPPKTTRRPPPKTNISSLELAFSPNATSLTDRPIISLSVACLTDTIDDVTVTSDHSRTTTGPVLGLPSGSELGGDLAIARYLARRSTARTARPSLLGAAVDEDEAEETKARIEAWVNYGLSQIKFGSTGGPTDSTIAAVAQTLEPVLVSRTYLVGYDLTLADIVLFTALGFPTLASDFQTLSTALQTQSFNSVNRWVAMVRSHPALREATQIALSITEGTTDAVFDANMPLLDPLVDGMAPLAGATPGNVVTRFPPEPSGYLHVGHAKALLMNEYYARRYKGRLIVRFDDTNPSKEKEEFRESILEDLGSLGVVPNVVTYTSDYFHTIRQYALFMIDQGLAYMDDTPQAQMQQERMDRVDSKHRAQSVADARKYFDLMSSSHKAGSVWCLRARIDMQSKNGTMRDPVLFRQNLTPHHRTGTTHNSYPTYDLACPIVDSIEGVTHALRTTEYDDRNAQYCWIQVALGLRRVRIHSFARMNFRHTILSKRHLGWFVDEGLVSGWDDARFPTVRGVIRRGVNVKALRKFICSQGASRNIVNMEWTRFWAENRKEIDLFAKRFMAIDADDKVALRVINGPEGMEYLSTDLLPKNPSFGKRLVRIGKDVILEKGDMEGIVVGEEIVLMRWGVVKITKVEGGLEGDFIPDGDFKAAKRKLTWLADAPETFPVTLTEFDNLISKEKLEDGDDFKQFVNPNTLASSTVIGDVGLKTLQKDEIIQLERRGYYRVDRPYMDEKRGMILYMIPDGKAKAMSGLDGKLAHR